MEKNKNEVTQSKFLILEFVHDSLKEQLQAYHGEKYPDAKLGRKEGMKNFINIQNTDNDRVLEKFTKEHLEEVGLYWTDICSKSFFDLNIKRFISGLGKYIDDNRKGS